MENKTKAVAYYRTSSKAGLGDDKDSESRQREAVKKYAASNGIEVVTEFYDAAVSGADHLTDRDGFNNLLSYVAANDIKIILFETVNRLARDVFVQLTGYQHLKKHSVSLIPVDDPKHFENLEENPMAEAIMIIIATLSMLDKKMLCKRLRSGIDKKRATTGRCEGRKPPLQDAVAMARDLRSSGKTYRAIAGDLYVAGYRVREKNKDGVVITTDRKYGPQSIRLMVNQYKGESDQRNVLKNS